MESIGALKRLGFSTKQAKGYASLVRLGNATAYRVAEESGLKRPTAYVILDELVEEGAAVLVPKETKKLYRAIKPETVYKRKQQELKAAESEIIKLQAESETADDTPNVRLFSGFDGVKEALLYRIDELDNTDIVGFYAQAEGNVLDSFDYYRDYNEKLRELDISMRGIVPKSPELEPFRETDTDYNRQMKVLPQDQYSSTVAFEITDSFVRIFDPNNLQGLIIENEAITKTLREIFELVWASETR